MAITRCPCCGSQSLAQQPALWAQLIEEWRLTPDEVAYVDRQQGYTCTTCAVNLRTMALAQAMMDRYDWLGLFRDFVASPAMRDRSVLELNTAGALTQYLSRLPHYTFAEYPAVDMMALPYPDESFDLIVNSDTLEHVLDPVRGLTEARRVLRTGGACAFTVPIIVGRLTRSRAGLPPSYHGLAKEEWDTYPEIVWEGFRVRTEYGADAWTQIMRAGFRECRITSLDYPAA